LKKNTLILSLLIIIGYTAYPQTYIDVFNNNTFTNINNLISIIERPKRESDSTTGEKEDKAQFNRWRWFWEQRTYPSGRIPEINHYYNYSIGKKHNSDKMLASKWSFIGPKKSKGGMNGIGRVNVVKTDPRNQNIFWAGAASGGLWKSTDAGKTWNTNTDGFSSLGISDIVIQPNNKKTMYLATGDADAASTFSTGVLKSTDAGKNWNTTGLQFKTSELKRIYKLVMHPTNYKILYAAGNNGIDKTTDGGRTWNTILEGNFFDFEIKPNDGKTIYAVDTKFHISTDGGKYWTESNYGWPSTNVRRVSIAVTPIAPNNVYALISANNHGFGGFYFSTNSGRIWQSKSNTPNILGRSVTGSDAGGQGWYDLCLAVSPIDENLIYVGGINLWRSEDKGSTWKLEANWYPTLGASTIHADHHDLWFIPGTATLFSANDGGIYRKHANSKWEWLGSGLGITQFYRLGCAATDSSKIIGGCQDNGTKLKDGATFRNVRAGDGMDCLIDYSDANTMYTSIPFGTLLRSEDNGRHFNNIRPVGAFGNWVTPFIQHPSEPSTLFAAMNEVYKTTDKGDSWLKISKFKIPDKKALNFIAVAKSNPDYIYTGQGNGIFKMTSNGGKSWQDIERPVDLWITHIAVSPHNPSLIYITLSAYTEGEKIYRSKDAGKTWENISGNLPNVPFNVVVCEENTPNRIYLGCDIGVFYRDDTKKDWVKYSEDLPNTVVNDLYIHYSTSMLRAATYGRGLWQTKLVKTEIRPVIIGDTAICGNTPTTYYTQSFDGIKNTWTVENATIEGSPNADTITVIWDTPGNSKIKLIQKLAGSERVDSISKVIHIFEKPVAEIEGMDTLCNKTKFTFKTKVSKFRKKWEVTGGTIIGSDTSKTVDIYFDSDTGATLKLSVYTELVGCESSSEMPITLNTVSKPNIIGADTTCTNSEANYTCDFPTKLIPVWKVNGGNIINNIGNQITVKWQNEKNCKVILTLINQNTGCRDSSHYPVHIVALPPAEISGDFTPCLNTPITYNTSADLPYKFKWTVEGGRIVGTDTAKQVSVIWENGNNTKLSLSKSLMHSTCKSDTTITISTLDKPNAIIGGDDTLCLSQFGDYYVKTINGNTVLWSVKGGEINGSSSDSTIRIKWTQSGIGTVRLSLTNPTTNCTDTAIFNVMINPLPPATFSGNFKVCPECTEKYFVNAGGFTNKWTINGGNLQSPDNADTITVKWSNIPSGKIMLKQTSPTTHCSFTTEQAISISEANKPNISGTESVCANSIHIYTTSSSTDYQNEWSAENGIIIGTNISYIVKIKWTSSGSGKVKLKQTNKNTHKQNSFITNITVYAIPKKPSITREGMSLRSNSPNGNQWYFRGKIIAGEKGEYYYPTENGIYKVRVENENKCLSEFSDEYNFVFNSVSYETNNTLTIFPNPIRDELHISTAFHLDKSAKIRVINILGMECKISSINISEHSLQMKTNCPNGSYMLIMYIHGKTYYRPFIISK